MIASFSITVKCRDGDDLVSPDGKGGTFPMSRYIAQMVDGADNYRRRLESNDLGDLMKACGKAITRKLEQNHAKA